MGEYRIPREMTRVEYPFKKLHDPGYSPSYPIHPAAFLPVHSRDNVHDDPIVLPPGTWVGRLDRTQHSALWADWGGAGALVPACPAAYLMGYTALDVEASGGFATPDIDVNPDTPVAAAGNSTTTVAAVKPLGVLMKPLYAGWLSTKYENYKRDLIASWRSRHVAVTIPAITTNEKAIQIGDVVILDTTGSPVWKPTDPANCVAGRIKRLAGETLTAALSEYRVGRCIGKTLLGKQASTSAGQSLRAAIGTAAPRTLTNFDPDYKFPDGDEQAWREAALIETPDGLGLGASSATLGREPHLLFATADASGYFWSLDIEVSV